MADLYGVCGAGELAPAVCAGFNSVRSELTGFRSGITSDVQLAWLNAAITAHHTRDSSGLITDASSRTSILLLGGVGESRQKSSLEERILDAVTSRRYERLFTLEPRFLACVVEEDKRALTLISDRYGLIPLYFAQLSGALAFSTRLHALPRAGLVPWELDEKAVLELFTYEHLMGNRTLFKNAELLGPASVLTFEGGQARSVSYRPTDYVDPARTLGAREGAERMYDALSTAVKEQTRDAAGVRITLSGGLDSRALLGCAHAAQRTISTASFGLPGCRDLLYAKQMAEALHVPQQIFPSDGSFLPKWIDYATYITGAMVGSVHFHILALASGLDASETVLDGMGGDAFTGAHLNLTMYRARTADDAIDALFRQRASVCKSRQELAELFDADFLHTAGYDPKDALRAHFQGRNGGDFWKGCHDFDVLERQRRFVQIGPSLMHPLCQVRTPFYARDFLDVSDRLAPRALFEQRAYVRMHARHIQTLARVPDAARGIPLTWPFAARLGKKAYDAAARRSSGRLPGYPSAPSATTNYRAWFRQSLLPLLRERLTKGEELLSGVLKKGVAQRLIDEHSQDRADHSAKFGVLLSLSNALYLRGVDRILAPET